MNDKKSTSNQAEPGRQDDQNAAAGQSDQETRDMNEEASGQNGQSDLSGKTGPEKAAQTPDDTIALLEEEVAALIKEKDDFKERFYRVSAEFDNYKKRIDRQWSDFKKYSHETLVKELLTVVDNLERAVEAAGKGNESDNGLVEGVKITLAEIFKIFERFGITALEAKGEKFDPVYHQAVSTQPAEDVAENTVLEELQKGYLIHDRLLRPAMVVVSVAPSE
ncbi:MAG: nucleotide exchange factor GrpE [Desulfosudaceae bacterium]